MKQLKKVKMTVSGIVQGVGFRYMTKIVADKLHITGIVRNLENGDVYIEAQGDTSQLDLFIKAIKTSPSPSGRVDDVSIVYDSDLPDYASFKVTY